MLLATNAEIALAQQRVDQRDLTPEPADLTRLGHLLGGRLDAQIEQLLPRRLQVEVELLVLSRPDLLQAAVLHTRCLRTTSRVRTGSLCAARLNASTAFSCGTPPSS